MRLLYPHSPFNHHEADTPYQEEFLARQQIGVPCSLFDFDSFGHRFRPNPPIQSDEPILYRGWMMTPEKYGRLTAAIEAQGGRPLTTQYDYTNCHHMPRWYDACASFTPETHFFPYDDQLHNHIAKLGWDRYFVKDFVKSNTTQRGSIAQSAAEAIEIVHLIETYRGTIEGGIAIRRVEEFLPETEQRYFVFNGRPHGPTDDIPPLVTQIAARINAPFFSVDTIQRTDGTLRLVEIGDGQVSDKKSWATGRFIQIFAPRKSL